MSKAVISDQAVIKNDNFVSGETVDIETQYADNEEVALDVSAVNGAKERQRVEKHIEDSKSIEQLEKCLPGISDDDFDLMVKYDDKKRELTAKKK
jgi:hypothetical protein